MASKAQQRATQKWERNNLQKMTLRVRKDTYPNLDDIRRVAEATGDSLNNFVVESARQKVRAYDQEEGQLQDIKDARAKSSDKMKEEKANTDWYEVIVFENEQERKDFMKAISIPAYERYIIWDQFKRLLKK